jgi:hypothetical protein
MTTDDFRRIVLALPGSEELNGFGYPNFCVGRKRFAALEGPDLTVVLRLTRDQQATFVAAAPRVFAPVSNGWGKLGSTEIRLEGANEAMVQDAIATAWRNVAHVPAEGNNVTAKIVDVGTNVARAADVTSPMDLANVIDVVPFDAVQDAVERLQSFWKKPGPASGAKPPFRRSDAP